MKLITRLLILLAITTPAFAQDQGIVPDLSKIDQTPVTTTLLDRYVETPDPSYKWELLKTDDSTPGITVYTAMLTSQTWRTEQEVSHPAWTHVLQIAVPDKPASHTALLMIGGGSRKDSAPSRPDQTALQIAKYTGSIVASIPNIPNQPMILQNDGDLRYEDDLLAESWSVAATHQDPTWIIHLAMVKAAVMGMTATQEIVEQETDTEVKDFVVTGASKRGWTTWLTAAVDDRVKGIMPVVIDTLNMPATMKHHWEAYGFFSPAIGDYAGRHMAQMLYGPLSRTLREVVDPYLYRDRLTMPKLLINSAGDQYFLPDTTKYYLDDLPGETRLRLVPNTNHSLRNRADVIINAASFYKAVADARELPELDWDRTGDGELSVRPGTRPTAVTLWQATNPDARDFRQESIGDAWTSTTLEPDREGIYTAHIDKPDSGFTAYFVEVTMPVKDQALPLTFTTEAFVIPDVLPYKDKPME